MEESGFSSFVCKVHFGSWSLEISKRFGRDEISNPGTRFWEWPGDCTGVCRPLHKSQDQGSGLHPRQIGVRRSLPGSQSSPLGKVWSDQIGPL
ncbi:unnamed protein product [Staurois parvus]|uniref:Uncharacterized protein n=1 Tax=Staurois parvus TaxID=386267 RepID=A0ABN9F7W6_9NEOB|nr:unnamed protein product [Staurois parvus]